MNKKTFQFIPIQLSNLLSNHFVINKPITMAKLAHFAQYKCLTLLIILRIWLDISNCKKILSIKKNPLGKLHIHVPINLWLISIHGILILWHNLQWHFIIMHVNDIWEWLSNVNYRVWIFISTSDTSMSIYLILKWH